MPNRKRRLSNVRRRREAAREAVVDAAVATATEEAGEELSVQ